MNNYLKLVNFEVKRFLKIFVFLISAVVITQIIGVIISSNSFLDNVKTLMRQQKLTESQYTHEYGEYSLYNFLNTGFFQISVVFAATVLVIYVFFIWYRDWFGKSSFIYRLLMLPTERRNVYFAKLTAILLFVLCLVGVQVVLLEAAQQIIQWIVPEQLRVNHDVIAIYSYEILTWLYPKTLLQFVLIYGLGITIVAVVFTAILFERSYHLKGIFLAAFYSAVSVAVIIAPIIIQSNINYFYEQEIILMTIVCSFLTFAAAIFMADHLLKRKINV